jgi:hypothetical protein
VRGLANQSPRDSAASRPSLPLKSPHRGVFRPQGPEAYDFPTTEAIPLTQGYWGTGLICNGRSIG